MSFHFHYNSYNCSSFVSLIVAQAEWSRSHAHQNIGSY